MAGSRKRLFASLAAAWEAEVVEAHRLTIFAERSGDPGIRARLLVLAAFCRAHASRILSRLSTLGRCPLPVPPGEVTVEDDLRSGLRHEASTARAAARRYESMAETARTKGDLSSAWVCELNRAEQEDLAIELSRLANREDRELYEPTNPVGTGLEG